MLFEYVIPKIKDEALQIKRKIDKNKEKKPSREQIRFKERFYELMFELGLYNKFKKTYLLDIKGETNYGFFAHLYLPIGLSFDELTKNKTAIEQNLRCLWIMNTEPFQEYAQLQIVLHPVDYEVEYKNPKIKPHELYLGRSFSNAVQKTSVNDSCMFLLSGGTGSGKTIFIYQVLLSWILGSTPEEVLIYLADISKDEYIQFANIEHVKEYASEMDELYEMMEDISKELKRRKGLLSYYRERNAATNIHEYNKISGKKLPYLYVVIDELSIIQPDSTDNRVEKHQKQFVIDTLKQVAKTGRGMGVFTFVATQKTTRDEMPSVLKNMSEVRISFKANDRISSEVIMENDSAVGLPQRVAVYSVDGGSTIDYLYTPKLTTKMLGVLLKPHIKKDRGGLVNNYKSKGIAKSTSRITRVPDGMTGMEYLKLVKSQKSFSEGDYNDYGS